MRYSKARELVVFTSAATVSTMIRSPQQIWEFIKMVTRDFGMPHRWGWAEDLDLDLDLEGGAVA